MWNTTFFLNFIICYHGFCCPKDANSVVFVTLIWVLTQTSLQMESDEKKGNPSDSNLKESINFQGMKEKWMIEMKHGKNFF